MLGAAQGQTTAVTLLLSAGARVDLQDKVHIGNNYYHYLQLTSHFLKFSSEWNNGPIPCLPAWEG